MLVEGVHPIPPKRKPLVFSSAPAELLQLARASIAVTLGVLVLGA